jgi:histidinol-phosphate aminotransferase
MSRFPRDDYRVLRRYVPDRRPVEIDLTDNTNLWGTHPAALRAVRDAVSETLSRYPDPYADRVREAVSNRFGIPPANVATGCGTDDILDAAFRAASREPGLVRYPVPTFSMVQPFLRMNGHLDGAVPWSTALADPEALLDGGPALVYLCRPNNPTGHSAPGPWLNGLLEAIAGRGDDAPLLLVDEAYAEYSGEGLVAEAPGLRRVLVLRTLSKAFGLAGMRVGWAAGSTEVIDEVEKSRGPYKVGRLAEAAAVAALEDEDGWVPEVIAHCLESRSRLVAELEGRDLAPFPTAANFLFLPLVEGTAVTTALALRERGVAVRPFSDAAEVGDGLRVTVGPWPLMERFLSALDRVREAAPDAWTVPDRALRLKAVGIS